MTTDPERGHLVEISRRHRVWSHLSSKCSDVTLSARGVAVLITAALALCLVSFLAGAFVASNHPGFQNCFTPQTPCMDSSD